MRIHLDPQNIRPTFFGTEGARRRSLPFGDRREHGYGDTLQCHASIYDMREMFHKRFFVLRTKRAQEESTKQTAQSSRGNRKGWLPYNAGRKKTHGSYLTYLANHIQNIYYAMAGFRCDSIFGR